MYDIFYINSTPEFIASVSLCQKMFYVTKLYSLSVTLNKSYKVLPYLLPFHFSMYVLSRTPKFFISAHTIVMFRTKPILESAMKKDITGQLSHH